MSATNALRRSIVLKRRPKGEPSAADFETIEEAIPNPAPGEVLTRTIWLSIDPYMRGRLREQQTYAVAIQIGEVMTGETVGEVIVSADPRFKSGDFVVGSRGWQTHSITPADRLTKIEKGAAPLSAYLGVLGMPGTTAYAGVTEICKPKPGETFVVSAASGAVGSVAGQIAKRAGARVVGIAGGPEKCLWVQDALGFDDCVDHRAMDLTRELQNACPNGIDCYYENVGGAVQEAVFERAQPVFAGGNVRDGLAIQRGGASAGPQPRLRRRQERADPGLHRLRPAGALRRVADDGRTASRGRQPCVSRGRNRGAGECTRRRWPASWAGGTSASCWSASRMTQTEPAGPETQGNEMKFGASMFFTDYSISPAALAKALEERGFDTLWAPEHSHIPLSRKTPFIMGGDLPKRYYDVMDPFVTLAAAAAVTTKLRLGTGVCLIAQRDPIQLAKLVASIDQVSGGRFLFGVGNGWNQDEMENHGTVFATRHKLARERIEAMKEIWTKEKAEYHGEFVNFDPMSDVAEAGAEAAPADPGRRRVPLLGAAGRALCRWVDAPGYQRQAGAAGRGDPAVPPDGGRGRARPGLAAHHYRRPAPRRRPY